MAFENNPSKMRVASYNIRKTRGLDQRRDPHRILDVINTLDADVIALQEADHRLGRRPAAITRDLIEHETDFEVAPVATNDVSLGWHGNAVLTRKGISVSAVSHIKLPGLEPRGAVCVSLRGPNKMNIVATHLGLARRSRIQQLKVIADSIRFSARTVLLADFNEWSRTRGLEPIAGLLEVHTPGLSFHTRRPIAALDRIGLSLDLKLQQSGVETGSLAKRASDHLPIWGDVVLQ